MVITSLSISSRQELFKHNHRIHEASDWEFHFPGVIVGTPAHELPFALGEGMASLAGLVDEVPAITGRF